MNKYLIFGFFLIFAEGLSAQEPTIVFGEAEKPNGGKNIMMLEQPEDAPNPLGNPIYAPNTDPSENQDPDILPADKNINLQPSSAEENAQPSNVITENLPVDPAISAQTLPQEEAKKIQNTIFQRGNRIVDVQSIPIPDIDKVEEPNLQPAITTYPDY